MRAIAASRPLICCYHSRNTTNTFFLLQGHCARPPDPNQPYKTPPCMLRPHADYTVPQQGAGTKPGPTDGLTSNVTMVCPGTTYVTAIQPILQGPVVGVTPDPGLASLAPVLCSDGSTPNMAGGAVADWPVDASTTGFTAVTISWTSAITGVTLTRGDGSVTRWKGRPPGSNVATVSCPSGMLVAGLSNAVPSIAPGMSLLQGSVWRIGLTCRYGAYQGMRWCE